MYLATTPTHRVITYTTYWDDYILWIQENPSTHSDNRATNSAASSESSHAWASGLAACAVRSASPASCLPIAGISLLSSLAPAHTPDRRGKEGELVSKYDQSTDELEHTMTEKEDKYPSKSGRRRFVKGVVGAAALAALGTIGATAVESATAPAGEGGGPLQYFGIDNIGGPAPRGMPQIPVEIDEQGFLSGIWSDVSERQTRQGEPIVQAQTQLGGITYFSEWFQYCGLQTFPSVQPDADQDNHFRSDGATAYTWQQQQLSADERLNIRHFEDYQTWGNDIGTAGVGKPALATWRSQGEASQGTLVVQVLRSTRIEALATGNSQYSQWINASTQDGFIAWLNKCTHFCCVPGYKMNQQSGRFGAANKVYCPCHQSVYDPFSIGRMQFVAMPRPEVD